MYRNFQLVAVQYTFWKNKESDIIKKNDIFTSSEKGLSLWNIMLRVCLRNYLVTIRKINSLLNIILEINR